MRGLHGMSASGERTKERHAFARPRSSNECVKCFEFILQINEFLSYM